MKGKLFFVSILCMCFLTPSAAMAKDLTTTGQLQIVAGRPIDVAIITNTASLKFYVHMSAFMDFGSDTQLVFGYFGPQLALPHTSISFLGGVYLSPDGGTSALTSLWVDERTLFTEWLSWFGEFDAYFPIDTVGDGKHTQKQFYVYSAALVKMSDQYSLGIATEHFFTTDKHNEAAVGPALSVGNVTYWAGIDFTPEDGACDTYLLRAMLFF